MENGFFRQAENPASCRSAVLQPPEAVAAMTGMVREFPTLAVRSSFNTSNPFICGIFKSVIIRS